MEDGEEWERVEKKETCCGEQGEELVPLELEGSGEEGLKSL